MPRMRVFSHAYKEAPPPYLVRHGETGLAASIRNSGPQNPCRANYHALCSLRDRLLGIGRARWEALTGDVLEGVVVEMATTTPEYTVVVFLAGGTGPGELQAVYHGDELNAQGEAKNDFPGCRVFGRSSASHHLCYHVALAVAARAVALDLDAELVGQLEEWWHDLDRGQDPLAKSEALERAADALYYHLREAAGGPEVAAAHMPRAEEERIEVLEDLTPGVLGRPARDTRLAFPGAPAATASRQAPRASAASGIEWPEPPDLEDDEKPLVPSGVVYYPAGDELEDIARHIRLCRERNRPCNILLPGEAAAGKTTLAAYIAQQLGQPLVEVHCSASMDHMALVGSYQKVGDQWQWSDGEIIRAARRGWVVYIDEVHRLPAEVSSVLHGLLDHRRLAVLADCQDPQLRYVKAHPRFTVIASGNEGENYRAVPMDPAFRSRWHVVYLRDLPMATRTRILVERCGLDAALALEMVKVQDLLWRLYRDGQCPYPPDMRSMVDWGDHTAALGGTPEAAWIAAVHTVIDKVAGLDGEVRRLVADRLENVFGPPPKAAREGIRLEGDAA